MINYLNWMAQHVIKWPEHYTHGFVITENGIPQYVRFNNGQGFSKAEWQAERDEMAADAFSSPDEDEAWESLAASKAQNCSACGGHNKQIENDRLRAQIQSLRDYCDRLLVVELKR